jgi:DNA-binding CsgD family transcriptional regulator
MLSSYKPPPHILSDMTRLARTALEGSGMDSVGLYRFDKHGSFSSGLILGMPDPFTRRYEVEGIPIDPVLAEMRASQAPVSSETILGDRWQSCHLFRRVSGEFGLKGFAAMPLFEESRLAGILYLGAMTEANRMRLNFEGICQMSSHAARLSVAFMRLPKQSTSLSQRQNDVARLAACGLANREIARTLDTGEAAVRKHLKSLNLIFGTRNRTAMAAQWRKTVAAD